MFIVNNSEVLKNQMKSYHFIQLYKDNMWSMMKYFTVFLYELTHI